MHSGCDTSTSVSRIAPIFTAAPHVRDAIAACVNHNMELQAKLLVESIDQVLSIVQLVVTGIPLTQKLAWILTACVCGMLAIEAIAITRTLIWFKWTHGAQSLIVGNVGRKASHLRHWQIHVLN